MLELLPLLADVVDSVHSYVQLHLFNCHLKVFVGISAILYLNYVLQMGFDFGGVFVLDLPFDVPFVVLDAVTHFCIFHQCLLPSLFHDFLRSVPQLENIHLLCVFSQF